LIFLAVVYRASGIIAALALFTYVVIILAILKYAGIVLTLASIAGLVLSIGIAIDANILIFERIKDEIRK
jgi:preprotein translocase subunit SecD